MAEPADHTPDDDERDPEPGDDPMAPGRSLDEPGDDVEPNEPA